MAFEALIKLFAATIPLVDPDVAVDRKTLDCMTKNIWFEARASNFSDKVAVGQVVLNRVADPGYPDDVCAVVWQPHQFSWTHDGKSDRVVTRSDADMRAWHDSVLAAVLSLGGELPDITGGAKHYHADYVDPSWSRSMSVSARYGDHIYYGEIEPAAGAP